MVVVVVDFVDFVFVFGDVDVDVVSFVAMMIMRIVVRACVNFLQW